MRIGTFVMGGIAGAAIVMLMRKNRVVAGVASTVGSQMRTRMNDMKKDVVGKALNMKFVSSLDAVKNLVEQDPSVSKEVNKILEQNEAH